MTDEPREATREEFEHHIAVTLGAAMALRKIRPTYQPWYNADVLAKKLWEGGFRLVIQPENKIWGRGTGEFYKHLEPKTP